MVRSIDLTLMSKVRSQSATSISRRGAMCRMPALFTRTSRPPRASAASSTEARAWATSARSATTAAPPRVGARRLDLLGAEVDEGHGGAFGDEPLGDAVADATGAAGDHRPAAG